MTDRELITSDFSWFDAQQRLRARMVARGELTPEGLRVRWPEIRALSADARIRRNRVRIGLPEAAAR